MKASEEHARHKDETKRLIDELQQRKGNLADLLSVVELSPLREEVVIAREALDSARSALSEHVRGSLSLVRGYRVLNSDDGREILRFTADYEMAPWKASKLMAQMKVGNFVLEELQSDGNWLPYQDSPFDRNSTT